jgi:hypothetical protein
VATITLDSGIFEMDGQTPVVAVNSKVQGLNSRDKIVCRQRKVPICGRLGYAVTGQSHIRTQRSGIIGVFVKGLSCCVIPPLDPSNSCVKSFGSSTRSAGGTYDRAMRSVNECATTAGQSRRVRQYMPPRTSPNTTMETAPSGP